MVTRGFAFVRWFCFDFAAFTRNFVLVLSLLFFYVRFVCAVLPFLRIFCPPFFLLRALAADANVGSVLLLFPRFFFCLFYCFFDGFCFYNLMILICAFFSC